MTFKSDTDHFDQHFLIDDDIINKLLETANLKPSDIVVEIGPGKGNISKLIAKKIKKLYCIEIDRKLEPFLTDLQIKYSNVEVIYGNALNVDYPVCNKIITSLPYSIIEPLMPKFIANKCKEIIMIVGKKFADNVSDSQTTRLSLLTNSYYKLERIMDIAPNSFNPPPRVMSSLIKLTFLKEEEIVSLTNLLFRYLFYYEDKKLKNALMESLIKIYELRHNKRLTQKESKEIVSSLDIEPNILDKTFMTLSNEELGILFKKIDGIKEVTNIF